MYKKKVYRYDFEKENRYCTTSLHYCYAVTEMATRLRDYETTPLRDYAATAIKLYCKIAILLKRDYYRQF